MTRRLGYLLCCGLLVLPKLSFGDRSYLLPERIYLGDVAELIIEYDNDLASLYPIDSDPLLDTFEVLTSKSRVLRVVENSKTIYRMQWRLLILPRKSGRLKVPSLSLGDRASTPLVLDVEPVPAALASSQNVFLELSVEPSNPYVAQQIQLRTRLIHNTTLNDDQLSVPEVAAATVYRNVKDSNLEIMREGQRYSVRQRSSVVFADRAGELQFSSAHYRGTIETSANTPTGPASRTILRRSEALKMAVREPPQAFRGNYWLPAKQVEIDELWDPENSSTRVGEIIDWTIKISARGLAAAALPADLLQHSAADFRIYPDRPVRNDRFDGGDIIGSLEQRFALVPTRSGNIELPQFKLSWWDVDSDREQVLQLPARQLVVGPRIEGLESETTEDWSLFDTADYLSQMTRLTLLGLVAIIGLILAHPRLRQRLAQWRLRRRLNQRLREACRDCDPRGAKQALIDWSRDRWPEHNIHSLHQIAAITAMRDLTQALVRLDAALYSPQKPAWHGTDLWRLIVTRLARSKPRLRKPPDHPIPDFYVS